MITYHYNDKTTNFLNDVRKWFPNKSLPQSITAEVLSSLGVEVEDVPEPVPTFEEMKEAKKAEIAAARYEAEIAGVTVNGTFIKTDRESQALLTGACLQAVIDPEYSLNWKTADGTWIKLSAEDIKAVGTTVRVYVQSQFDEEERLCGLIDNAMTEEELEVIAWTSA